jgi:signal transduction histidine kinase
MTVKTRTAGRLPWALGLVALALTAAGLAVGAKNGDNPWSFGGGASALVLLVAFGGLGAILASRRPANPIGWIFIATGVMFSGAGLADQYAQYGLVTSPGPIPGAAFASWLARWIWAPASGVLLIYTLLLFPDGRLPSRRWRPVAWLGAVAIVVAVVPVAIFGWRLRGPRLLYANEPPLTLPHSYRLAVTVSEIAFSLIFLLVFVGAASLLVRLRRATGDEREQIRWFVYGGFLMAISVVASIPGVGPEGLVIVAFLALPVAATIAILKYRLYDIDVVINKTVVYGVLAAFFTAIYVAIVVGIGAAFGSRSNTTLTILAAVVMAVAFQPVRERARKFANRLVYGKRATPYEVLSEFSERMGDAYDAEEVLPQMARMLTEGTGATRGEVWLRVGSELRPAASWPQDATEAPAAMPIVGNELPSFPGTDLAFPVAYRGELLGALSVAMPPNEPLTPVGEKLISGLASQAGLVLRNVRLIEELRASRQRLVSAQDEERRRLERNLHDGAQQQLVALAVQLGLAQRQAEKESPNVSELLGRLQTQSAEALDNLRDLARGIYPPLLADQGLAAALSAQARKAPLPVEVQSDGIDRYDQEAEAAVYFCCLEALQNVAKYAGATRARVQLATDGGELSFEVIDDGKGFDSERVPMGSGLQNMADRLAALGGSIEVRSRPGQGTTVLGRLPVTAPRVLLLEHGEELEPDGVGVPQREPGPVVDR